MQYCKIPCVNQMWGNLRLGIPIMISTKIQATIRQILRTRWVIFEIGYIHLNRGDSFPFNLTLEDVPVKAGNKKFIDENPLHFSHIILHHRAFWELGTFCVDTFPT